MLTAFTIQAETGARQGHGVRRRLLLALPAAVLATALCGAPSLAASRTPATGVSGPAPSAAPGPATQGIIMSDGRICDPIRHMGC